MMCYAASLVVEDEKEEALQSFLEQYTTRIDPNTDFESKEGLRDEIASMKKLIFVVGGSLSFIIGIIGVINFINTMLTSIITRKREFAMLQSIGLTNRQLRRMLLYEGLYYVGFTAFVSVIIGSYLSLTIIKALNKVVMYFEYQYIVSPFLTMLPVFLFIGILVPGVAYNRAKKQSIVERLREAE